MLIRTYLVAAVAKKTIVLVTSQFRVSQTASELPHFRKLADGTMKHDGTMIDRDGTMGWHPSLKFGLSGTLASLCDLHVCMHLG